MEVLRKQNERMSKQVADLSAENRKLLLPLKQATDDVKEYKRQLQNYEKDKISLAVIYSKLCSICLWFTQILHMVWTYHNLSNTFLEHQSQIKSN